MSSLKERISNIDLETKKIIEQRLNEFRSFKIKQREEWFSELCFCLLTANSRAKTAINIQKELGYPGFSKLSRAKISESIKRNKHRFHNNKARYIVEAREHLDIRDKVSNIVSKQGIVKAREWLVDNIKGLGYKEASHFLRNTGHESVAILDRHILNLLAENEVIEEVPKPLNKLKYLNIEDKFNKISFLLDMTPAKLDLCMWYLKTGEVLK